MKNGRYEENGVISWYKDDVLHRTDGPAVEKDNGYQAWYEDGLRHRLDGPAVIRADKSEIWYKHGKKHRLLGPAEMIRIPTMVFRRKAVGEIVQYTWWWEGVQIPRKAWELIGMKEPPDSITEEEAVLLRLSLP